MATATVEEQPVDNHPLVVENGEKLVDIAERNILRLSGKHAILRTMTRQGADVTSTPDLADIHSVYQQLGLTSANDRAYYMAFNPRPTPTLQLTVHIGSTSLPQ